MSPADASIGPHYLTMCVCHQQRECENEWECLCV